MSEAWNDAQIFTDQPVYIIYEYNDRGDDRVRMVFEDDASTLVQVIDYASSLSEGQSEIVTGEFHAANPGEKYLRRGDWYLTKQPAVGISHGLRTDE